VGATVEETSGGTFSSYYINLYAILYMLSGVVLVSGSGKKKLVHSYPILFHWLRQYFVLSFFFSLKLKRINGVLHLPPYDSNPQPLGVGEASYQLSCALLSTLFFSIFTISEHCSMRFASPSLTEPKLN